MAATHVKQEVQALINSAANADEKGDYFVRTHSLCDGPNSASPRSARDHLANMNCLEHVSPSPTPYLAGCIHVVYESCAVHLSSVTDGQQWEW